MNVLLVYQGQESPRDPGRFKNVWRQIYSGRKSWWALSHTSAVDHGLRNAYFAKRGLLFLADQHRQTHRQIVAPATPQLALWE
jgi:RNA-directed DNA polymerase